MNVLIINRDRSIFNDHSPSLQRHLEYSRLVDKIFIVVCSSGREKPLFVDNKLFIYPTNSRRKIFYIFDAFRLASRIIKEDKVDLLVTQDPFECGLAGYWLKRKFKIPLQLQIHTDFLSSYFVKHSMSNKLRVMIAKFLIPRTSCLRVVSERIKKLIELRFKSKDLRILVLPIFVDVEKIKNSTIKIDLHQKYPQFNFIILMASRLTKEKNIGLAIEAMEEIVREYPKSGLVIVGSGPEEQNLKSQISNLKINENIKIEPWTDDLVSYYKTTDLFLLTSNYEGYGMTLVEASAANCRIISTDVGIAGEILEEENICRVGNKNDLRNKIEEAIKKNIKPSRQLKMKSKEEHLEEYKNSWKLCAY